MEKSLLPCQFPVAAALDEFELASRELLTANCRIDPCLSLDPDDEPCKPLDVEEEDCLEFSPFEFLEFFIFLIDFFDFFGFFEFFFFLL